MKMGSLFLAIVGGIVLPALQARASDSAFNPNGTWDIGFLDRCSGTSQDSKTAIAPKAGDFQCSSYLGKKENPPAKDRISIRYDAAANSVKIAGGPSTIPRTIQLDRDHIGVSKQKLFPKTTSMSANCELKTYFLEAVRFNDSNSMEYGYVTVYEFQPQSGCEPYLSELKTAVKTRMATGLLLAMRDIHALNVDQMQNLQSLGLIEDFKGTRVSG